MSEEKPQKFGTQLRPPVKRHLDELVADYGSGSGLKQQIVEAALLLFFDSPARVQQEWIQRVRMAEFEGGTSSVIRGIKAKRAKKPHVTKE